MFERAVDELRGKASRNRCNVGAGAFGEIERIKRAWERIFIPHIEHMHLLAPGAASFRSGGVDFAFNIDDNQLAWMGEGIRNDRPTSLPPASWGDRQEMPVAAVRDEFARFVVRTGGEAKITGC
jgi:hypothetical protein